MKRIILISGIVLGMLILAVVSLPLLINANQFRPRIEASLGAALARQVTVGDLSVSLFSGSVIANDLSIADDPRFESGPFVHARALAIGVDLWPLIARHELNVKELKITEPAIMLMQSPTGAWNFSTAGSKSPVSPPTRPDPLSLSAQLISIEGGRLTVSRLGSPVKPTVLENVSISITDFAPGSSFPFSFSGKVDPAGQIQLDGNAGPINQADPLLTPVRMNLKLSGIDLAGLGISAGSGLAGLLTVDGTGSMNGQALDWKGSARIDQARFARNGTPAKQPVQLDFAVEHDLQKHTGVLRQGDIHLGNALASLTGTYAEGAGGTVLDLRLAGNAMPVSALTAMLPPLDIELPAGSSLEGGTVAVNATITGPTANVVVAGMAGLTNTRLKGFDLGSSIGAIERLAGIQPSPDTAVQTLSATVRSDNAGTAIQNLQFIAPAVGELVGTGSIDARHNLDFKMRATIHTQGILAAAIGGRHDTAIPFLIQGTAVRPEFKPDVAGIAAAEVQRLTNGKKIGGVDAGQAVNAIKGLFGK